MSEMFTVKPGERRVVRLFALDMPREQIRFLRDEAGAVADKLGVETIDANHVDILKLADLDELGLTGYLIEGCGISEAETEPDRAMLSALDGYVMAVFSRAFDDRAETLVPGQGLRLLRVYGQPSTDWSAAPAPRNADIPGGRIGVSPRTARTEARRIGGTIFAIFMVLIALGLWALLG